MYTPLPTFALTRPIFSILTQLTTTNCAPAQLQLRLSSRNSMTSSTLCNATYMIPAVSATRAEGQTCAPTAAPTPAPTSFNPACLGVQQMFVGPNPYNLTKSGFNLPSTCGDGDVLWDAQAYEFFASVTGVYTFSNCKSRALISCCAAGDVHLINPHTVCLNNRWHHYDGPSHRACL